MSVLAAFEDQIAQLPDGVQLEQCALIALGRQYATDVDAGHTASGGGLRGVLADLRRITREAAKHTEAVAGVSELDALRAKRKAAGLME
jgi:hypothetical protein